MDGFFNFVSNTVTSVVSTYKEVQKQHPFITLGVEVGAACMLIYFSGGAAYPLAMKLGAGAFGLAAAETVNTTFNRAAEQEEARHLNQQVIDNNAKIEVEHNNLIRKVEELEKIIKADNSVKNNRRKEIQKKDQQLQQLTQERLALIKKNKDLQIKLIQVLRNNLENHAAKNAFNARQSPSSQPSVSSTKKPTPKAAADFDNLKPNSPGTSTPPKQPRPSASEELLSSLVQNQPYSCFSNPSIKNSFLQQQLPANLDVGAAMGAGDCFFHSVAQGLDLIRSTKNHTVKGLRLLCSEYIKDEKAPDWVKTALNKEHEKNLSQYLARVQFTANEMKVHNRDNTLTGSATWGNIEIEGRIIAEKLNIKIHAIECSDKRGIENKKGEEPDIIPAMAAHQIVSANGSKTVVEFSEGLYTQQDMVHIVIYKNHMSPILPRAVLEKEQKVAALSSNDKKINPHSTFSDGLRKRKNTVQLNQEQRIAEEYAAFLESCKNKLG